VPAFAFGTFSHAVHAAFVVTRSDAHLVDAYCTSLQTVQLGHLSAVEELADWMR
jgi:hypothetical protein